jgi:hypothetical protein
MKKLLSIICLIVVTTRMAFANINIKDHYLFIGGVAAPPALVVIKDAAGNKSGVDESRPLDEFGRGKGITEIQGTDVEQQNIASDEPPLNQPQSSTSWSIYVMDQPAQTYSVDLIGIKSGVTSIDVSGGYIGGRKSIPRVRSSYFVTQGATRAVTVNYDPTMGTVGVVTQLGNGDFLKDTQAACGLGSISPSEACEALEALAAMAEKAKTKGDSGLEAETLELYVSILNRLHNWGLVGYRKDWDDLKGRSECDHLRQKDLGDTKFFAKDPAYSALKLDAETLLGTIPKDDGDGNKHDKNVP